MLLSKYTTKLNMPECNTQSIVGRYTVFIAQAYQTFTELLITWRRAQAFLTASGAALSEEVADGKINVQSACALNTRYNVIKESVIHIQVEKKCVQ
jgi:hypothetical protein